MKGIGFGLLRLCVGFENLRFRDLGIEHEMLKGSAAVRGHVEFVVRDLVLG